MAIVEERTSFLRHRAFPAYGMRPEHRTSPTTAFTSGGSVSQLFDNTIT
jgi:hypothetical protein